MIVIFDNELIPHTVADFCDELQDKVYKVQEGDWVDVYISTVGGANHVRHPMLNCINKYRDYIKIYINFEMLSNGFILLLELAELDIPIYMTKDYMFSMIHKTDALLNNHRPIGYEPLSNVHIKKYNNHIVSKLKKLGVSEDKINEFKEGKDIYFSATDTLKLFPNIKLLK